MVLPPTDPQQPDTTEVGYQNDSRRHDHVAEEIRFRAALAEAKQRTAEIKLKALDSVLRDLASLRDRLGQ